ncbi:hypothetical protein PS691_05055 [Pseudomonas fluorescens]|uniref:Uncharacterized protein n=1 Tax=Pseudomonas fluorescens TaxID=294 RepID=A0A5E7EZZ6_PSEFL|nr:hypothetical protein PS691_05055 [Pseudomonas fluorescens]
MHCSEQRRLSAQTLLQLLKALLLRAVGADHADVVDQSGDRPAGKRFFQRLRGGFHITEVSQNAISDTVDDYRFETIFNATLDNCCANT